MSNPASSPADGFSHHLGLAAVLAAGTVIGIVFLLADDASAGRSGPELIVTPTPEPAPGPNDPTEITRLSLAIEVPDDVDHGGPAPTPTADPAVIYVNMDGANLTCGNGSDNALNDYSVIACQYGFTGAYPSYGGTAAQRQSVIDAVEQDWSPFNAIITTTRPNAGPYTMCMTGPANHPFGNGVLGVAPLDCNDNMPSNIVFAFHSASQLGGFLGANTQATTISQEVAHAYGLEHVASSSDIMNPYNQGGNPAFTDTCIGLVSGQGQPILCTSQHSQFCPNGQQNSYQELLDMWGSNNPDVTPPNVVVAYPHDGDVFDIGSNFTIECAANDDQSVAGVELWINDAQMGGTRTAEPYSWDVTNIPAGSYDIYCIATDDWDNTAMSPVITVTVEEGGMPGDGGADTGGTTTSTTGSTTGSTGSGSGTDSGAGGETGGLDTGGLPPGYGLDNDAGGCACNSDTPARSSWVLLTLLALPLVRRRREHA
jgi:MYXO-CTERM domain-containing protein